MSRTTRASVVALLTVAGVGPVLYPLWMGWRTRRLPDPDPPEPRGYPGISVIVPAYREREVIADKVRNTLENGYPGEVEVIVVAEDADTAAAAGATPARVVGGEERRGKAAAMNTGVRVARMPIVVLTDANAMLDPGGLARAARWLEDPSIGAVAGEKRILSVDGEGLYWAFESWLKRRETRTGTSIGLSGELMALRRDEYVELPTDLAVDDLWLALDVIEHGKRVVYDPQLRVHENASGCMADEWQRRTRVVCGTLDVLWRRRRMLLPRRSRVAGQLWGHRLVRSSPGPVAHALLLALALRALPRSRTARGFVALHAAGGLALVRRRRQGRAGRLGELGAQVLFLQAVGIGGTVRWLRGDRPARWPKPERARAAGAGHSTTGAGAHGATGE
jgi:biofilm PGA synthesis N-glycosyltransferase PgaC